MPLYEILCLVKPAVARPDLANVIRRLGDKVLSSGGVITDIKNYGVQLLAYDIRKPFQRHDRAHMWQMNFVMQSQLMEEVNRDLKLDENVLRWIVLKRPYFQKSLDALLAEEDRNLVTPSSPPEQTSASPGNP